MHRRTGSTTFAFPAQKRDASLKFHLHDANDDDSSSDSETAANNQTYKNHLKLPFPSSFSSSQRPLAAPAITNRSASNSETSSGQEDKPIQRPAYPRTASSPIILSNGKPLKSSLKSSSSSPFARRPGLTLDLPARSGLFAPVHTRAASAPVTPNETTEDPLAQSGLIQHSPSADSLPGTPKNVHFASELSSVRIYNRAAKPAALSQQGDETETDDTEVEGDIEMPGWEGGRFKVSKKSSSKSTSKKTGMRDAFPFPSFGPPNIQPPVFLPPSSSASTSSGPRLVLSPAPLTSPIPNTLPSPYSNLHLESLSLIHTLPTDGAPSSMATDGSRLKLYLQGTILVRNLSYAKTVAVRFTLDEWQTTSEVQGRFQQSCVPLPKALARTTSNLSVPPSRSALGAGAGGSRAALATSNTWDRFSFTIRLEDYVHKLEERTLWLVVRYSINDGRDEWWDNNSGRNYRLAFTMSSNASSAVTIPGIAAIQTNGTAGQLYRERGLSTPAQMSTSPPLPTYASNLDIPPYKRNVNIIYSTPSPEHRASPSFDAPPVMHNGHPASHHRVYSYPSTNGGGLEGGGYTSVPKLSGSPSIVETGNRVSSPYRDDAMKTTTERLAKLSLKNYATPKPRSTSSPSVKEDSDPVEALPRNGASGAVPSTTELPSEDKATSAPSGAPIIPARDLPPHLDPIFVDEPWISTSPPTFVPHAPPARTTEGPVNDDSKISPLPFPISVSVPEPTTTSAPSQIPFASTAQQSGMPWAWGGMDGGAGMGMAGGMMRTGEEMSMSASPPAFTPVAAHAMAGKNVTEAGVSRGMMSFPPPTFSPMAAMKQSNTAALGYGPGPTIGPEPATLSIIPESPPSASAVAATTDSAKAEVASSSSPVSNPPGHEPKLASAAPGTARRESQETSQSHATPMKLGMPSASSLMASRTSGGIAEPTAVKPPASSISGGVATGEKKAADPHPSSTIPTQSSNPPFSSQPAASQPNPARRVPLRSFSPLTTLPSSSGRLPPPSSSSTRTTHGRAFSDTRLPPATLSPITLNQMGPPSPSPALSPFSPTASASTPRSFAFASSATVSTGESPGSAPPRPDVSSVLGDSAYKEFLDKWCFARGDGIGA